MSSVDPIQPGGTIGVLGSGQLGRMFAIAARRLGYRVHTLSPGWDTPTGQVADVHVTRSYDDPMAVRGFAGGVDVVTFEFENIPASAVEAAALEAPVRPPGSLLHASQNRVREKTALHQAGFPVTPFQPVGSLDELQQAIESLGAPVVLKTAGWGYDGKGQMRIDRISDAARAWESLATDEAIVESMISFRRELSVIVARGADGSIALYGPVENRHRHHILDVTLAPAHVEDTVRGRAEAIGRGVAESFDLVGVLCVELFETEAGELLINEVAPRPHNSGHYTIDACVTCQFEQQVRAVCGLPLGSPEQLRPAAMVNLLGDLWQEGEPDWSGVLAERGASLHLYGKRDARLGRKMGHITVLGEGGDTTADGAAGRAMAARDSVRPVRLHSS